MYFAPSSATSPQEHWTQQRVQLLPRSVWKGRNSIWSLNMITQKTWHQSVERLINHGCFLFFIAMIFQPRMTYFDKIFFCVNHLLQTQNRRIGLVLFYIRILHWVDDGSYVWEDYMTQKQRSSPNKWCCATKTINVCLKIKRIGVLPDFQITGIHFDEWLVFFCSICRFNTFDPCFTAPVITVLMPPSNLSVSTTFRNIDCN